MDNKGYKTARNSRGIPKFRPDFDTWVISEHPPPIFPVNLTILPVDRIDEWIKINGRTDGLPKGEHGAVKSINLLSFLQYAPKK